MSKYVGIQDNRLHKKERFTLRILSVNVTFTGEVLNGKLLQINFFKLQNFFNFFQIKSKLLMVKLKRLFTGSQIRYLYNGDPKFPNVIKETQ